MRLWKDVATLVKARHLNGRFVARPAADFPFIIEEGMSVAFVPPKTDMPRRGVVNYVRELDGHSYEVGFDKVIDESTAACLAGCHCLARRADLEGFSFAGEFVSWVGLRVVEVDGAIVGEVCGLVENPGQDLLEVRRPDGRTVYIPVVDEIVREVDFNRNEISVELPRGLLDL